MDKKIIAITGPTRSGKGEVSRLLQERGYVPFVFSDRIREYARTNPNIGDKEELQDVGDFMRKYFGHGILAALTLRLILKDERQKFVISGIRHPAEIRVLKDFLGDGKVTILGVYASQATRFEFVKLDKKNGNPETFDQFKRIDDRELYGGNGTRPHVMNINECLKLVDASIITNEMGIEKLICNTEMVFRMVGIDAPKIYKERG